MNNIIFIIALFATIFFAYIADKNNNKFFLVFTMLIPTTLAGFRGITVGVDTPSYYNAFINNFPIGWQFEEEGFRTIVRFLSGVLSSPTYIMLIFAVITNFLIILRLWDFRKKCSFSFMIFIYMLTYFIDSINIMRQFISISVIFYSTKLLEKKKYVLFTLIVLLMTTIHKTSLLGLALIVIYMWNDLSKKRKFQLFFPIILVSTFVLIYVFKYESAHIINYFSSSNSINNINFTYIYRILIFIIAYLLNYSNKKIVFSNRIVNNTEQVISIDKKQWGIITTIYIFGLLFGSMGMFYFVMARLGYYYLIYETIFWGYLTKNSKNNTINKLLIAVYVIYVFALELLKNGSGIFPYSFGII